MSHHNFIMPITLCSDETMVAAVIDLVSLRMERAWMSSPQNSTFASGYIAICPDHTANPEEVGDSLVTSVCRQIYMQVCCTKNVQNFLGSLYEQS